MPQQHGRVKESVSVLKLIAQRIARTIRPQVEVLSVPSGIRISWNEPVVARDGTVLRVNIFLPEGEGPFPVIMSAHPYNKDLIPAKTRSGRAPSFQNRIFLQPETVRYSALTSWEAPDPVTWVKRGYCVINADLRGGGSSQGRDTLFSQQEAEDYFDLIEWAGTQEWSTGKVGLLGVSYLAISQYRVASLRPPHLAAICPWEGFSDLYRDFVRPGGILENGFSIIWSKATARTARVTGKLRNDIKSRETRDDWYDERTPRLEDIEVPMLVCGSFSDQNLHSRGSFEAFRRSGSQQKWLYTHRGGKWSTFYSEEASKTQEKFFDWALKGARNGWEHTPAARIAVFDKGPDPASVFNADHWPPRSSTVRTLYGSFQRQELKTTPPVLQSTTKFDLRGKGLRLNYVFEEDVDTVGPLRVSLHLSLEGTDDASLFVGVRKFREGKEQFFEGSYGFSGDMVSHGWQRVGFDELDKELSTPLQPVHTYRRLTALRPGEIRPVHIALLPQATRWRRGDVLQLHIRGKWFYGRNPITGQFPSGYQKSSRGTAVIHSSPQQPATLTFATLLREVGMPNHS